MLDWPNSDLNVARVEAKTIFSRTGARSSAKLKNDISWNLDKFYITGAKLLCGLQ